MSRRFLLRSLLIAGVACAAACGGRTPLYLLGPEQQEDSGPSGVGPFDAGPTFDASAPHDAGVARDGTAPRDARVPFDAREETTLPHDAGLRADVFIPPGPVPCDDPPGLQPGSPWPIARRCPSHAGYTKAIGPTTAPSTVWQAQATGVWGLETVIAADGTIYAYDTARGLVALGSDGSTKWVAPIAGVKGGAAGQAPNDPVSLAIAADGTIYAWSSMLTAVHTDGTTAWTAQTARTPGLDETVFPLAVGNDGTIYVVDHEGNGSPMGMYAFDATGRLLQTFAGSFESAVTVGSSGALFVVTAPGGQLVTPSLAAYTQGGQQAWTATLAPVGPSSPGVLVGSDGTVYAPCEVGPCGLPPSQCSIGLCSFTADGALLGLASSGAEGQASVVVAQSPAAGLLAFADDTFIEVIGADGGTAWDYPFSDTSPTLTQFFDGRGTYFTAWVGYPGGATMAVAPDHSILWNLDAGYPVAMGGDGTLYTVNFGSMPSVLSALR